MFQCLASLVYFYIHTLARTHLSVFDLLYCRTYSFASTAGLRYLLLYLQFYVFFQAGIATMILRSSRHCNNAKTIRTSLLTNATEAMLLCLGSCHSYDPQTSAVTLTTERAPSISHVMSFYCTTTLMLGLHDAIIS